MISISLLIVCDESLHLHLCYKHIFIMAMSKALKSLLFGAFLSQFWSPTSFIIFFFTEYTLLFLTCLVILVFIIDDDYKTYIIFVM